MAPGGGRSLAYETPDGRSPHGLNPSSAPQPPSLMPAAVCPPPRRLPWVSARVSDSLLQGIEVGTADVGSGSRSVTCIRRASDRCGPTNRHAGTPAESLACGQCADRTTARPGTDAFESRRRACCTLVRTGDEGGGSASTPAAASMKSATVCHAARSCASLLPT